MTTPRYSCRVCTHPESLHERDGCGGEGGGTFYPCDCITYAPLTAADLGRMGGKSKSPAKVAASRANAEKARAARMALMTGTDSPRG